MFLQRGAFGFSFGMETMQFLVQFFSLTLYNFQGAASYEKNWQEVSGLGCQIWPRSLARNKINQKETFQKKHKTIIFWQGAQKILKRRPQHCKLQTWKKSVNTKHWNCNLGMKIKKRTSYMEINIDIETKSKPTSLDTDTNRWKQTNNEPINIFVFHLYREMES